MKKTVEKIPKLSSLIKRAEFDWVNPYVTDSLFPVPERISSDYRLFGFEKGISSEDAAARIGMEGFRPANAWEIAAYAKEGWDGKELVIGLGSVGEVDGNRFVPVLSRYGSERNLRLRWWVSGWDAGSRFLAVRNSALGNSDALKPDASTLGNSVPCPHCGKDLVVIKNK